MLGLFMAQSYTSAMDCFSADPSTYPYATSWVIKTANIMAEIDFGSLARNAMMTDDFHLVLADWTGRRTNFVRVYVMRVTAAYWRGLFPIDVTPFLAGSVFEGISNMHADDEVWKRRRKALQEQWQAHLPEGSPMKVRFKRDHKIQRRVQCAMSREGFHRLFAATFDAAKTTELELALDH